MNDDRFAGQAVDTLSTRPVIAFIKSRLGRLILEHGSGFLGSLAPRQLLLHFEPVVEAVDAAPTFVVVTFWSQVLLLHCDYNYNMMEQADPV